MVQIILYNFRYRGPYEYDKFVLNIFQFHNEIRDIELEMEDSINENLLSYKTKLDELIIAAENICHDIELLQESVKER